MGQMVHTLSNMKVWSDNSKPSIFDEKSKNPKASKVWDMVKFCSLSSRSPFLALVDIPIYFSSAIEYAARAFWYSFSFSLRDGKSSRVYLDKGTVIWLSTVTKCVSNALHTQDNELIII